MPSARVAQPLKGLPIHADNWQAGAAMVQPGRWLVPPMEMDPAGDRGETTWPLQLGQPISLQPMSRIWLRAPTRLRAAVPRIHGRRAPGIAP
jgi:hypothetical protein